MEQLPSLKIHQNGFTTIEDSYFNHSVGGASIEEETVVKIMYDNAYLHFDFDCRNNPRMDQNYYTVDNSALYNQEVFEIFISLGSAAPKAYFEIQLNPNNALYFSKITFGVKSDDQFEIELLDIKKSGIIHSVTKNELLDSWSGRLSLPLTLFPKLKKGSKEVFRFNLYRLISKEDHFDPNWIAIPSNAVYACWSSTYQKTPQFHVPDRFGFLYME